MALFATSIKDAEDLISKSKKLANGDSLDQAGIGYSWMSSYATIALRCRDDKEFGLS